MGLRGHVFNSAVLSRTSSCSLVANAVALDLVECLYSPSTILTLLKFRA